MSQAANAAALATQDYNQRQKMELDYQATIVSLNIAQAAATQKGITQQTKMARDATAAAQSSAATATQSAYLMNVTQTAQAQVILNEQTAQAATATQSAYLVNVTQTAQAQAILDAQVKQTVQAVAASTAYPLTATPFAMTQAALLMQQYDREQQSFVDQVVAPLIPIVAILVLVLFILVIILAYRRYNPMPWPRRLLTPRVNVSPSPLIMIDGVISDHNPRLHPIIPSELAPANPPGLPGENMVNVEIVDATEPPVAHWIAEVEHQLAN